MTQALLTKPGRYSQRPAHFRFFVCADGHRRLTTQIDIDGDSHLCDDFAFASRDGLEPELVRIGDPVQIAQRDLEKPFASIDFNFRLLSDSTNATPVSGAWNGPVLPHQMYRARTDCIRAFAQARCQS